MRKLIVLLFLFGAQCKGEGTNAPSTTQDGSLHYYVVGPAGAKSSLLRELQPGFGFAVVDVSDVNGEPTARTRAGELIPTRSLVALHPTKFSGHEVDSDSLDFGWVIEKTAALFSKPDDHTHPTGLRALHDRVTILARDPPGWLETPEGFLRAAQVRAPSLSARPAEAGPTDRWIDVDTSTETLVAYEGDHPRFATLVSTGVGAAGAPLSTPRGVYRVFSKLTFAKMDNLDHDTRHYLFEDVPWVQYFNREIALHGAYWHQRFGHAVSHGCVNLAPADAERLFGFTAPRLPTGASEIAAAPDRFGKLVGTVVRVR